MDFQNKNFSYVTMKLHDFIDRVEQGHQLYMRSLSASNKTEHPAVFQKDFSALSADFSLPGGMSHVLDNAHSSPLRISGPVVMWLHYDVRSMV